MTNTINELISHLKEIHVLQSKLNDKTYWINRAKEETGFIPQEGDWIHVEVTTWKVEVSVYHEQNVRGSRHWINGVWFDTSFPGRHPNMYDIISIN